jgi:ribonuclease BN (tRNA processing enzyme)
MARGGFEPAQRQGVALAGQVSQAASRAEVKMKITVVGCGDAFGSGGRLQTCFHVEAGPRRFLIDCGATAIIGLNKLGLDPNEIETIFISHLHGDHFAGLVWWMLHAQHVARRSEPLTVVGPEGVEARFVAAAEALFPRSTQVDRRFALNFVELRQRQQADVAGIKVTPFEVSHPSGAPPYALRFEVDGRMLAFSGDSEWVEDLVDAGRQADLLIIECYGFDTDVRYHMSWRTIEKNLPRIGAQRVLLTHMNASMLENRHHVTTPDVMCAEDGMVIEI